MRSERRDSTLPSCPPARNCKDVLQAAGIEDLFEVRIDGIVVEQRHLHGKPAPDTFLAAAKEVGVEPAEAAVFEDALAGVEAGRAGASASSSESTAPVSARLCSSTAPTLSSPTWPSCWSESDHPPRLRRRALERPRERSSNLNVLAQTESVFALSNGHIGLRANLDEGEPYGSRGPT